MAFTFIHTGDWHVAKPFGRFEADKQALLREARATIVERIGELARSRKAEAVLVAGDVFDAPLVADDALRRLAARLGRYDDVAWHFLPGNHDPAVANGVWQRFARFVAGGHVAIHLDAALTPIREGVDLLAAPLYARAIAHDPTAWMDDRTSASGHIRIGLAHGAVQGFGSAGAASVLIDRERAQRASLDYLALGDWHGAREAGPRTWYAGTPEPDQFLDNEPGYALSVTIAEAGAAAVIERHRVAQYRWQRHSLEGDPIAACREIERRVADGGAAADSLLLRLDMTGRVTIADELGLRYHVADLAGRVFHVEADYSGLCVDTGAIAMDTFADPVLAAVGAGLASRIAGAVGGDDAVAHEALRILAAFAHTADEAA